MQKLLIKIRWLHLHVNHITTYQDKKNPLISIYHSYVYMYIDTTTLLIDISLAVGLTTHLSSACVTSFIFYLSNPSMQKIKQMCNL